MSARTEGSKRRWGISAAIAAAAMLILLPLFRAPKILATSQVEPRVAARGKQFVTVTPGRHGELALRDLAPLFLPTSYNAAPTEPLAREPALNVFDADTTKLNFGETDPGLQLPTPLHAPGTPAEVLADSPAPLAAGIGRTDAKLPTALPHGAYLEVFAASSGESVLIQTLDPSAGPKAVDRPVPDWRPLEFMAAVDPSGLVGQLVLTTGSGSEDVDNHFRNYLARTFRIGDRLTPGFYRIVVGP
jgi:hypothetical protein